jgi:hypothetical protein
MCECVRVRSSKCCYLPSMFLAWSVPSVLSRMHSPLTELRIVGHAWSSHVIVAVCQTPSFPLSFPQCSCNHYTAALKISLLTRNPEARSKNRACTVHLLYRTSLCLTSEGNTVSSTPTSLPLEVACVDYSLTCNVGRSVFRSRLTKVKYRNHRLVILSNMDTRACSVKCSY